MSAEWEQLLQDAKRQLDVAERERETREADEEEKAVDLKARFDAVSMQYAAIAASFAQEVLARGLPGKEDYTFDRRKKPLFGSRFVRIPLVLVPGVARSWYQVGEGATGPIYSHEQALAIGTQIRPTIMPLFTTTEWISMQLYRDACTSAEGVYGLARMLTEAESYGAEPEGLLPVLKEGLAAWAAKNCPELKLDIPAVH
jgi:hypothetical protein